MQLSRLQLTQLIIHSTTQSDRPSNQANDVLLHFDPSLKCFETVLRAVVESRTLGVQPHFFCNEGAIFRNKSLLQGAEESKTKTLNVSWRRWLENE